VTNSSAGREQPAPRTWLFVPGDRPERFRKASASIAHEVICDLEDAVGPAHKVDARNAVVQWLSTGGSAWVRVNATDTEWHRSDVSAIVASPGLRGLIIPKAEDPAVIEQLAGGLRAGGRQRGVIALVESARGILRAHDLASSAAIDQLAFGSIDYAYDVNSDHTPDALLLARTTLVLASRAARKPAPIDGVTTAYLDLDAVVADARYARELGFGAKLCIHPAQLAAVEQAFRPTDEELAWARQVLSAPGASETAASGVGGHMIDAPVLDRAARVLATSESVAHPDRMR
jgi:citrate lyase subunit beta/citryl-CoA lyase